MAKKTESEIILEKFTADLKRVMDTLQQVQQQGIMLQGVAGYLQQEITALQQAGKEEGV